MLAEHRRRGMDFYLITQHPQNIDNFVRRLVGSPGWHRHLKRTFGADLVSCIEWEAVNTNCEKSGSGKNGQVTMVGFPKEVYGWYQSASLHTGKKKIPRAVWTLGACALLVPLFGYLAITGVYGNVVKDRPQAVAGVAGNGGSVAARKGSEPLTKAEYVLSRSPRIEGFPHTAPAYDQVTQPTEAPYPAACLIMANKCRCYTQQSTRMAMADEMCRQIVEKGFFVDFKLPIKESPARAPIMAAQDKPASVLPQVVAQPPVQLVQQQPMPPQSSEGYTQGLAARNAQVRSVFQ